MRNAADHRPETDITVTILSENVTRKRGIKSEHGLSL